MDTMFSWDDGLFEQNNTVTHWAWSIQNWFQICLFFFVSCSPGLKPHWANIGHTAKLMKFLRATTNKDNSIMDSPEMCLEIYIQAVTPAHHRLHTTFCSCCYSGERNFALLHTWFHLYLLIHVYSNSCSGIYNLNLNSSKFYFVHFIIIPAGKVLIHLPSVMC